MRERERGEREREREREREGGREGEGGRGRGAGAKEGGCWGIEGCGCWAYISDLLRQVIRLLLVSLKSIQGNRCRNA